jgi:hypothetical protein
MDKLWAYPTLCKADELASDARQFLTEESNGLQPYTLDLDYDYWTAGALSHDIQCTF